MKGAWGSRRLGAVASTVMGQAPPGENCNKEGKGTPFVKAGEFGAVRPIIREWTTNPKKLGRATDVFVCVVGATCGKINLGADCAIGRSVAAIRPDSEHLDQFFLHYYLHLTVEKLRNGSLGAAQTVISQEMLANLPIPLPPLDEQQRIVTVLDEAFEGLRRSRENAMSNVESARELLAATITSLTAQNPSGGTAYILGDVCDLFQGLAINQKTSHLLVEQSPLPLLRIKDLRNGSHEQYVSEVGYPEQARVTTKDLIYTRTGQIGLVFRGRSGVLHNNCFKIVPRGVVSSDYLFWALQERTFRNRVIGLASRAAQPDITHKLFKAQEIVLPSLEVQRTAVAAIEKVAALTEQLEEAYREKQSSLDGLKTSILQRAFAGG